jgi:hypothetical protein
MVFLMNKYLNKVFLICTFFISLSVQSYFGDPEYFESLEFGSASEYSYDSTDYLILKSCSIMSYRAANLEAQSSISNFIQSISSNSIDYGLEDDGVISNATTVYLKRSSSSILSNFIELHRYQDVDEFCLTTGIPLTQISNTVPAPEPTSPDLSDLDMFLSDAGIISSAPTKTVNSESFIYKTTIGQYSTINGHSVLPRDGAIKNALNNAIAEALGISIKSQSLISSMETTTSTDSVSNDIFSFMSSSDLAGKIDSYEILSESESNNIYTVKIKSKITLPSSDKPTIQKIIDKLSNPLLFVSSNNQSLLKKLKPILVKYGLNLTNIKSKSILTLSVSLNNAYVDSNTSQITIKMALHESPQPNNILATWGNDPSMFPIFNSNDVDKVSHAYLLKADSSNELKSLFTKGLIKVLSVGGFYMNAIIERGGISNIDRFKSTLSKSDKFNFESLDVLPHGYLVRFYSKNSTDQTAKSLAHYISLFASNEILESRVLSPSYIQYSHESFNVSAHTKKSFEINISNKYSFDKSLFLSSLKSSDQFVNIRDYDEQYGSHIIFDFYNDPSRMKDVYHQAMEKSVNLDQAKKQKLSPYLYESEFGLSGIDYHPLGGQIYKVPSFLRSAIEIFDSTIDYLILLIDYLSVVIDNILISIRDAIK